MIPILLKFIKICEFPPISCSSLLMYPLLTKHNLQISLFCVLTRFLEFMKTVITMQLNKMTVFIKIFELNKLGTILYLLIFHSSLLCSKFVANWCQSGLEDPAHVMIVIEVGFLKVLLIYLFLCYSFFDFFLCIYALEWNHVSWRFFLSHI